MFHFMVEGGKGEAGLEAMLTCRCSMGLTACIAQMVCGDLVHCSIWSAGLIHSLVGCE